MAFSTFAPSILWTKNILAAGNLARAFLADEWDLSPADRTWLTVFACRSNHQGWQVELGIYGCPDRWIFQVSKAGVCDSAYSFQAAEYEGKGLKYLEILPDAIAAMLLAEHASLTGPYFIPEPFLLAKKCSKTRQ
jgi:hypothetical protein